MLNINRLLFVYVASYLLMSLQKFAVKRVLEEEASSKSKWKYTATYGA